MLAGLLLFAQFFTQLHALGHLEDSRQDAAGEATCLVCLLGAGLDAGAVQAGAGSCSQHQPAEPVACVYSFVSVYAFHAFAVRAPPLSSSIA